MSCDGHFYHERPSVCLSTNLITFRYWPDHKLYGLYVKNLCERNATYRNCFRCQSLLTKNFCFTE
jgi:hypothetical protein